MPSSVCGPLLPSNDAGGAASRVGRGGTFRFGSERVERPGPRSGIGFVYASACCTVVFTVYGIDVDFANATRTRAFWGSLGVMGFNCC